MKKNKFYNSTSAYFENGIIREIYSNEHFSICNVANQCYAVFYLQAEKPIGIIVNAPQVRAIVNDDKFLVDTVRYLNSNKRARSSRVFSMDIELFNEFQKLKLKNDLNGPSEAIDFDMELELKNRSKSK